MTTINKQIPHLNDQRTLVAQEKIGEQDERQYTSCSLQTSKTLRIT